ncbi:MAG TPA: hypothetical protein VLW50_28010 [Streptosporangiaceae bacterium]|nr:hypothetical protein [Streptosporangiaceae bacterium]
MAVDASGVLAGKTLTQIAARDVDAAVVALRNTGLPNTQCVWTLDKMTSSRPPSESR